MHGDVVAELLDGSAGEGLVLAFDLLKAADVGLGLLQPSHEVVQARLDAVDVPGGDQHYAPQIEKDGAAAAGGGGVGIVDLEGCADQPVLEIDLGAEKVDERHGIDQNGGTVAFDCKVIVHGGVGQGEIVLESRAAAAEHRQAQRRVCCLFRRRSRGSAAAARAVRVTAVRHGSLDHAASKWFSGTYVGYTTAFVNRGGPA